MKAILGQYLLWNKARLDCFARMLLSILITRTVNSSEIAVAMASDANVGSRYKRLQKFFRQFSINYDVVAKLIFSLFFSGKKYT